MAVRLSALRAGCPLPPGRFPVLISVRGRVDPRAIVWLEGLDPMMSSGIEPTTWKCNYNAASDFRKKVLCVYNHEDSGSIFHWDKTIRCHSPNGLNLYNVLVCVLVPEHMIYETGKQLSLDISSTNTDTLLPSL
jgi:hypothetical protein